MQALSLWEMMWQLGVGACVMAGVVLVVGLIIFLMFKPLNWLDNL